MWVGDIEVPDELVSAHREGRLVLFVGAGASLDPPSDLPTFKGLVDRIAEESGFKLGDKDAAPLDRILGDLDVGGPEGRVDVHRRVAEIIGSTTSSPSELHRAIAALASSGGQPRVVTTNYDRHLSTCLTPVVEYSAPALPMGDDFTGVVYLHGSLDREMQSLVVTDSDFGRAYLTDAWAARFLERMFRSFAVLFIGYSHDDVVMSYLARGLPRSSARYVLTHRPERSHWRRLGIEPIAYPMGDDGSHAALNHAIGRWADLAGMGMLHHEQRVSNLVAHPPSGIPEEASYLEQIVADPLTAGLFAQAARGLDWLDWAASRPQFQSLFRRDESAGECGRELAWWFAEHFVCDAELSGHALGVLTSMGGQLDESLWLAIAQRLHIVGAPRPAHLNVWLVVLVEQAPRHTHSFLDYALCSCRWPQDREVALLLFGHLTEPHVEMDRFLVGGGTPRVSVTVRGDDHFLNEAVTKLILPNMDGMAGDLLSLADHHLQLAQRLIDASQGSERAWDSLSFRRSAIEPHGQTSSRDGFDIIVDVARDSMARVAESDPSLAQSYLDRWASSPSALLRRLAVHSWGVRTDVNADEKLAWLGEKEILYDLALQHEVFQFVANVLKDASEDVAARIIAEVLVGPPEPTEHSAYQVFNFVGWLGQVAPDVVGVRQALADQERMHPDFARRDHPDFSSWHEAGSFGHDLPLQPAELHDEIESAPATAIDRLLVYESEGSPWDGPTWEDALELLALTVQEWPRDGLAVLAELDRIASAPAVARSLVRGWSKSEPSDGIYSDLASAVGDLLRRYGLVEDASHFLLEQAKAEGAFSQAADLATAADLASRVWTAGIRADPGGNVVGDGDPLGYAINYWAGNVALFWVHAISAEWTALGEDWDGLSEDARSALLAIVAGSEPANESGQVVIASQLLFLFTADEAWSSASVLPLLDWREDSDRARRCWDGFLKWGRFNERLLNAGLLQLYLRAVPHLADFNEEQQDLFARHLASAALQSDLDPMASGWLPEFTAMAPPLVRVRWMQEVSWQLAKLPGDVAEAAWAQWMRSYWEQRLTSVPAILTPSEASAIAEWPLALDQSFAEAVGLAVQQSAGLPEHSGFLHRLSGSPLVTKYPPDVARWVSHLLRGTDQPFHECHSLADLVPALRSALTAEAVAPIVEEGLRLGCTNASSWD